MALRISAIILILLSTAAAWALLGATIFQRTHDADVELRGRVESIWGASQSQEAPSGIATKTIDNAVDVIESGHKLTRVEKKTIEIPITLESSKVRVILDLDPRRKGLLWYNTYKVAFAGEYKFRNTSEFDDVTFSLPFPAQRAIYDDFVFSVDGKPVSPIHENAVARLKLQLTPGATSVLKVGYRSQGMGSWHYRFGSDVSGVRDFDLAMKVDFDAIDFPESSLAPNEKRKIAGGWELGWRYRNLVAGSEIAMTMPEKLQPGPIAGRISFFAPVSLLFFFFLLFIITTMRNIEIHPMNYFFLATAFFAFHLLLAYPVDHISIHLAFIICSVVSVGLVVSYLRLVIGIRFALLEAGLTQLVYLVAFSYAFFFKGFTGLAITIGSIITLFVVMQMTGRVRWSERFSK